MPRESGPGGVAGGCEHDHREPLRALGSRPAEKAAARLACSGRRGNHAAAARAGATGGVTEAAGEGVNIAGELASGSNPNAGQGAGMRMLQAGVVGGLLGVRRAHSRVEESASVRVQPTAQTTNRPSVRLPTIRPHLLTIAGKLPTKPARRSRGVSPNSG